MNSGEEDHDISSHINPSPDRIGSDVPTVLWFSSLVLERKDCVVFFTAPRRGISGGGRSYSYRRSPSFVSVDELGRRIYRWSLSRFVECCSRPYVVSRRIFVSCP